MSELDHLVVAAADLAEGARWVEERLGVAMDAGGRHEIFGTHNGVLSLGPDCYLEVIAVDPEAPAPARARWFELDTEAMRARLAGGPGLVHWVVRVPSLADEPDVMELRRGSNRWALTVAPDGRMPLAGLAPSRILWHTPPPATLLPDKGIRLDTLSISTPDVAALRPLVADVVGPIAVRPGDSGLAATFSTPSGPAAIGGPTGVG
ncbi:VOC family protein [Agromyces albus]|uniref:VOC family protein n=1 Tax=Agromyces albus TaxID=205332 RepID=A0A4Q2KPH8_9MICO|nr:VOC family protein [Agromyces albus]RXZ67275.1 VOC family protein [Agromyces albus]